MAKKYDWTSLKGEYIRGEFTSISDFLKDKGIPYSGRARKKTAGWSEERETFLTEVEEETNKKTKIEVSETEAQIRARQANSAKYLQIKALNALKNQNTETAMESAQMMRIGMEQERKAMDMERGDTIVSGNVNIAVLNTRYGKMLQQLDDKQLKSVFERLVELDNRGEGGNETSNPLPASTEEGQVIS